MHGRDPMRTRDLIGPQFKAFSLIALSQCDGEMSIALPHRRVPQASSENDRNPRCDGVCPQKRRCAVCTIVLDWSTHRSGLVHQGPQIGRGEGCARYTCMRTRNAVFILGRFWVYRLRYEAWYRWLSAQTTASCSILPLNMTETNNLCPTFPCPRPAAKPLKSVSKAPRSIS